MKLTFINPVNNSRTDTVDFVDGLNSVNINLRREDDTDEIVYGYASELKFRGADAAFVKAWLVDTTQNPDAFNSWFLIELLDECCNKTYTFKLPSSAIEWCEGTCEVKANLVEYGPTTAAYDCIKSTLIYDTTRIDGQGHNFTQRVHPRFSYCIENRPDILQHFIIINAIANELAYMTLLPVAICVQSIITPVNLLIQMVNYICSVLSISGNIATIGGNTWTGIISIYQHWNSQLKQWAIGCGRKHPAPFVRDYIQNVCSKCGITFSSTIFYDINSSIRQYGHDYYNLCWWEAPQKKGIPEPDTATQWQDENRPIRTLTDLLDKLKPVFNAKYRIIPNANPLLQPKLYFERKDWFKNHFPAPPIDLTTYPKEKILSICYKWTGAPRAALANYEYSKDSVDTVANEALTRFNKIVDWQTPTVSPLQKGIYESIIEFGAVRTREDNVEPDILSLYDIPILGQLMFPTISQYKTAMISQFGVAVYPKLLIYDDGGNGSSFSDARVKRWGASLVNLPMWFDYLYPVFHYIDEPQSQVFLGYDVEIEIEYDCATLALVTPDTVIKTNRGNVQPKTFSINQKNQTMKITGTI